MARSCDDSDASAWPYNDEDASARAYDKGDASVWSYDNGDASAQSCGRIGPALRRRGCVCRVLRRRGRIGPALQQRFLRPSQGGDAGESKREHSEGGQEGEGKGEGLADEIGAYGLPCKDAGRPELARCGRGMSSLDAPCHDQGGQSAGSGCHGTLKVSTKHRRTRINVLSVWGQQMFFVLFPEFSVHVAYLGF